MLRITQSSEGPRVRLRLEGRLVEPWIGELRGVVEAVPGGARAVELDLGGLQSADSDGGAYLRRLIRSGARPRNASALMTAILAIREGGGHGRD